ncbi:MAG: TraB/GumN family protein [Chthoniobacterales bacterium]
MVSCRLVLLRFLLGCALAVPSLALAASPVWKVTAPSGGTLYLGGSIHALKSSDGALPPAFNLALAKSSRLILESDDPDKAESKRMQKAGEYPKGDSLKNHVDPRTYDYLKSFFGLLGIPEAKMARYRPWMLTLGLWSPDLSGFSSDLGVESQLTKRARAKGKPISGLVSAREHMDVFVGLTDKQSEAVLLLTFIPTDGGPKVNMMSAWRRGEMDVLWKQSRAAFAEYPAFAERVLEARNRRWMPKIEGYLRSDRIAFVVVGSAHLGGPEGLLTLLKKRGYQLEQL